MRKYLNYLIFGAIVLLVAGLAVQHSRHMRSLVDAMTSGTPDAQKAAVAELVQAEQFGDAISGEPTATRVKVAQALQVAGTKDAVKQALALLKDTDKPVRDQATQTLQAIGALTKDNVSELVNGLKDGDTNVRKGTIAALSDSQKGIGPNPKSGVDVVQAILDIMKKEGGARSPGGDVLSSSLFETQAARDQSVPKLIAMLSDKDDGVRSGAADALGKIGDARAVQPLITAMQKDKAAVRRVAIGAIALIADPSGEAALTEAVINPNDDNEARSQATSGLGKIATPSAIATLIKTLNDTDLKLRSAAVAALARAGKPATTGGRPNAAVLTTLTNALQSSNDNIRLGAAQALQALHAPETNPALIAALQMKDSDVQAAAATALGYDGNSAAIAPLLGALSDPSGDVNAAAADALQRIGAKATDALIATIEKGGTDAFYAATALGKQGQIALPALEKTAASASLVGQRWAAVALGAIGGQEVRPTLEQLARSSDQDVAFVAKQQLAHL